MMDRTYLIEIPIYNEELHLLFGKKSDCKEALRQDGMSEANIEAWAKSCDDCNGSFTEDTDSKYLLLWMEKLPEKIKDYGDLIHEIEHATFCVLNRRGLIHTDESDEAFAYLEGWLYEQIEEFIQDEKERNLQ